MPNAIKYKTHPTFGNINMSKKKAYLRIEEIQSILFLISYLVPHMIVAVKRYNCSCNRPWRPIGL
jgi:hypothetical protein